MERQAFATREERNGANEYCFEAIQGCRAAVRVSRVNGEGREVVLKAAVKTQD